MIVQHAGKHQGTSMSNLTCLNNWNNFYSRAVKNKLYKELFTKIFSFITHRKAGFRKALVSLKFCRVCICLLVQKVESLYAVWWWHCLSTNWMSAFRTADEFLILIGCLAKLWRHCACSMLVLQSTALCFTVQNWASKYRTVLHSTEQCFTIQNCASQYNTVLHSTALCFTV